MFGKKSAKMPHFYPMPVRPAAPFDTFFYPTPPLSRRQPV